MGLRYIKTYGLTHQQLAMVSVVQRQWTGNNPSAPSGAPFASSRTFTGRRQDSHRVRCETAPQK
jgi:hypothetical protein